MKMKCSKGFIITVVALVVVAWPLWRHWNEQANTPTMGIAEAQGGDRAQIDEIVKYHEQTNKSAPQPPQNSNQVPRTPW
jgi:hypothetical protein